MASEPVVDAERIAHQASRRRANERKAAAGEKAADAQGLVEFSCECLNADCERTVKVPLYVYRRIFDAGDQYLVQAAHHAFDRHRTIVTLGLMRIEERG